MVTRSVAAVAGTITTGVVILVIVIIVTIIVVRRGMFVSARKDEDLRRASRVNGFFTDLPDTDQTAQPGLEGFTTGAIEVFSSTKCQELQTDLAAFIDGNGEQDERKTFLTKYVIPSYNKKRSVNTDTVFTSNSSIQKDVLTLSSQRVYDSGNAFCYSVNDTLVFPETGGIKSITFLFHIDMLIKSYTKKDPFSSANRSSTTSSAGTDDGKMWIHPAIGISHENDNKAVTDVGNGDDGRYKTHTTVYYPDPVSIPLFEGTDKIFEFPMIPKRIRSSGIEVKIGNLKGVVVRPGDIFWFTLSASGWDVSYVLKNVILEIVNIELT